MLFFFSRVLEWFFSWWREMHQAHNFTWQLFIQDIKVYWERQVSGNTGGLLCQKGWLYVIRQSGSGFIWVKHILFFINSVNIPSMDQFAIRSVCQHWLGNLFIPLWSFLYIKCEIIRESCIMCTLLCFHFQSWMS